MKKKYCMISNLNIGMIHWQLFSFQILISFLCMCCSHSSSFFSLEIIFIQILSGESVLFSCCFFVFIVPIIHLVHILNQYE